MKTRKQKAEALGFELCEFIATDEPETCESCGRETFNLHFGNPDYFDSREGDYLCLKCIAKTYNANQRDYFVSRLWGWRFFVTDTIAELPETIGAARLWIVPRIVRILSTMRFGHGAKIDALVACGDARNKAEFEEREEWLNRYFPVCFSWEVCQILAPLKIKGGKIQ